MTEKRKIGINERMGRKRDEELAEIMAAIEFAVEEALNSRKQPVDIRRR